MLFSYFVAFFLLQKLLRHSAKIQQKASLYDARHFAVQNSPHVLLVYHPKRSGFFIFFFVNVLCCFFVCLFVVAALPIRETCAEQNGQKQKKYITKKKSNLQSNKKKSKTSQKCVKIENKFLLLLLQR